MKRFALLFLALSALTGRAELTLEQCLAEAEKNYPLICKQQLMEQTGNIALSDINRGWLPRVEIYGQATAQNDVPSFPTPFHSMLPDVKGLSHFQYKVGADLQQTVWDGGASRARRSIERASTAENLAALRVQTYGVRERVENLFFGILLIDEQLAQSAENIKLLEANLTRMRSLVNNGVATQADADMVEAQLLTALQQVTQARSARGGYVSALGLFLDRDLAGETLVKPLADLPASLETKRPEIDLFNAQDAANAARLKAIDAQLMPKIGLFAQAYYGYPGLNYFQSMMNRDLSFNIIGGIKLSWNLDALYTSGNSRKRLELARRNVASDRETFELNTRIQTSAEMADIRGLQEAMERDSQIIELRSNVRRSAESQLTNGVIDTTALLTKLTDENQAQLTARYHQIQLLQRIYKLRNTLNQ
ncbi:MAG: TolC family protein [Muribaculaceae bacterium]|nr:TolC family protein [Muribaculaceae bacterium]